MGSKLRVLALLLLRFERDGVTGVRITCCFSLYHISFFDSFNDFISGADIGNHLNFVVYLVLRFSPMTLKTSSYVIHDLQYVEGIKVNRLTVGKGKAHFFLL
jgi:hypothetical protein